MTGKEILEAEFEKAGMRGYRADQVDVLLQSIASFVDKQNTEIKDLKYKTQILADKIEEYKKDEESIRDALLGAQKMGSSILNEAKAKAETVIRESKSTSEELLSTAQVKSEAMVREAKTTSEDMLAHAKLKIENLTKESLLKANAEIANARKESEKEQKLLEAMKLEVSNFRSFILKQYKDHLDLLSNLPVVEEKSAEMTPSPVKTSVSMNENIKVEEIKDEDNHIENINDNKDNTISITNSQTIKSDIKVSNETENIPLSVEEKQQTREFHKRNTMTLDENETKESVATNDSDKFVVRGQRTSFAAKYGELDFGNHKDK